VTGSAPSGFTQEAQGTSAGAGSPGHNFYRLYKFKLHYTCIGSAQ
jgi:hypothetical protein